MHDIAVEHIPVLARALAERINLPLDAVMVDTTVGQGGHSLLFGQNLSAEGLLIGFDLDEKSLGSSRSRLKRLCCKVSLVKSNFSEISEVLSGQGIEEVDFVLADLGLCSSQITDSEIGLSFQQDMPLDMRIDKRLKSSAADIVNNADEKTLSDLIYNFGEERGSRRIAGYIVRHRKGQPIRTTGQLSSLVCKALGRKGVRKKGRIHPATKTFQALRIAVNRELENLKRLLESVPGLLKRKGCFAVISYHSLEDRLVKQNFKENKRESVYRLVTKKPIKPDKEEISQNRRARSAKLRIAEKI